ncbi:hypothetical protein WR30_14840 [Burkholderia contaminans FFH2055]|uniref:hypothetical protein n=1 Tax=Burkholderia contaminans TaxID=488447 RepID=UPI000626E6C4|nr:hypothetical protein [Burkholderia contaminans]KKL39254.1 hypothetical protein WR30_14840 [Burkholderia contaminans FFH2055]MEB4635269.1 hypothetical protein [Burkholderia contaminans]MEB4638986.1 hypothetical protein [Burkholderia contaminans]MEB4653642.1 hypothetical protein [Burkholderia contaminans]MEB4662154.1 hypothetical protein [Burkholderia contaminans]
MKPIERFTLETHDGPYETWPSRTHARVNGERCGLTVSGYVLLRQFETPDAYLLVTDYDCLFEEAVTFTLVSKDPLKALARRTVGAMYASCHLDDMTWADDRHFSATFAGIAGRWDFTIRDRSVPFVLPRLGMRHVPAEATP